MPVTCGERAAKFQQPDMQDQDVEVARQAEPAALGWTEKSLRSAVLPAASAPGTPSPAVPTGPAALT